MADRHRSIFISLIVFGIVVSYFFFYYIPKLKGVKLDSQDTFAILIAGFFTATLAPLIFGWILPPPIEWFPSVFREINESQAREILRSFIN